VAAVDIEFFTDFICPWCYIGKERMEKVINQLKDDIDIHIVPKPYILYPGIPIGGVDKSVFAKKTKPGMGRSLRDEAQIEALALNYKEIKRIPNSKKAHLLIALIEEDQLKWSTSMDIIRAYFHTGQDIEDPDYLSSIAESVGIDRQLFTSQASDQEVEQALHQELQLSREQQISLVPTIRLNKKVIIPGLQSTEVWTKYLQRASVMKL